MMAPRWHLRTSLTLLLAAASAIALLIAFALLLAYYQPRLAAQHYRLALDAATRRQAAFDRDKLNRRLGELQAEPLR